MSPRRSRATLPHQLVDLLVAAALLLAYLLVLTRGHLTSLGSR